MKFSEIAIKNSKNSTVKCSKKAAIIIKIMAAVAGLIVGYALILVRLLLLEISRQIIRVRVAPMLRSLLPLKLVVTTYVVLPIFFSVCLMVGIAMLGVWV